jgi:hypothetical protein
MIQPLETHQTRYRELIDRLLDIEEIHGVGSPEAEAAEKEAFALVRKVLWAETLRIDAFDPDTFMP